MNKTFWIVGAVAIVAIFGIFYPKTEVPSTPTLGAVNVEEYVPVIKYEGYNSAKPITLTGASGDITSGDDITVGDDLTVTDDATVSGGTFTVTTTNTATSTASVGCIQATATSTVTPIRFLYVASTTATALSGTQAGYVLWGYGTCPF